MAIPRTYQQYIDELEEKLTYYERLRDEATGVDERIDVSNRLLIETVRLLAEGLRFQIPKVPDPYPGMPHYNVRKYLLDTARTEPGEEIEIPGDTITAYTNGTLAGTFIRLDTPTNDAIPLNEFNPYRYLLGFKKFWLETTAQSSRYLRLHIGREAGADASVQITAVAPKPVFYTIVTDKDTHFTGALATGNKEDENISGLLGTKIRVLDIAIQADQALNLWLMFWRKNTFNNIDLDIDTFIGMVQLDLSTFGKQVGGAGQYYMSIEDANIDYEDEDGTNELHVSLYNADAVPKNAGVTGEISVFVKYELRG